MFSMALALSIDAIASDCTDNPEVQREGKGRAESSHGNEEVPFSGWRSHDHTCRATCIVHSSVLDALSKLFPMWSLQQALVEMPLFG